MDKLNCMISITNREELKQFLSIARRMGAAANFISLGHGTAFIDSTPKAITYSFVTGDVWKKIKPALEQEMDIDLPNRGIVFTVPLSSIGSMRQMKLLIGSQEIAKREESVLKDTNYELIIIIANTGYSDEVMWAARKGGAKGGTVIHAKGTGMEGNEDFFGVTLAAEKEMIYTVVKSEKKNDVMKAVMEECGLSEKPQAVVMSLPVTSTAGMRFYEIKEDGVTTDEKEEKDEQEA